MTRVTAAVVATALLAVGVVTAIWPDPPLRSCVPTLSDSTGQPLLDRELDQIRDIYRQYGLERFVRWDYQIQAESEGLLWRWMSDIETARQLRVEALNSGNVTLYYGHVLWHGKVGWWINRFDRGPLHITALDRNGQPICAMVEP